MKNVCRQCHEKKAQCFVGSYIGALGVRVFFVRWSMFEKVTSYKLIFFRVKKTALLRAACQIDSFYEVMEVKNQYTAHSCFIRDEPAI